MNVMDERSAALRSLEFVNDNQIIGFVFQLGTKILDAPAIVNGDIRLPDQTSQDVARVLPTAE